MKYKNTDYPRRSKDLNGKPEHTSEDVITFDEHGMLNIGYWNYDTKRWSFHTETLFDPYENDELINFVWMYKPNSLKI